jgi:hypothetical protein
MSIGAFLASAEWKELIDTEDTRIIFPYGY